MSEIDELLRRIHFVSPVTNGFEFPASAYWRLEIQIRFVCIVHTLLRRRNLDHAPSSLIQSTDYPPAAAFGVEKLNGLHQARTPGRSIE